MSVSQQKPEPGVTKRQTRRASSKQCLEEIERLTVQMDLKKESIDKPSYSQFFQKYLPAQTQLIRDTKEKPSSTSNMLQVPVIIKRQRISEIRDENYKIKREEELKKKEQEMIAKKTEELRQQIVELFNQSMQRVKDSKPEILNSIGLLKQQGKSLPQIVPPTSNPIVELQEFRNSKLKQSQLFRELIVKMIKLQSQKYAPEELLAIPCFRHQLDAMLDFVPKVIDFCLENHKVTNSLYVTIPCLKNYNLRERVENLQQIIDMLETIELNFNSVQESQNFSISTVTGFIGQQIAETKKRIFLYDQEDIKPKLKEENYNFIERLNTEFQTYNSEFIALQEQYH